MSLRPILAFSTLLALFTFPALAAPDAAPAGKGESLADSVCRVIETAAKAQNIPVAFLTRLIWQESSFRADAVSPKGARGIAQFMPGTAAERGLANPFDPEEAIPKAAELLSDLRTRFGNLGLAAAAYNAGPARVTSWLAGGFLPSETRTYVQIITRRPVEDWTGDAADKTNADATVFPATTCVQTTAAIRRFEPNEFASSAILAPWGVQIAGGFSKTAALAAYARARTSYPAVLGDFDPMVIGGRFRSRGNGAFYRVRAPARTRQVANSICDRIHRAGGVCIVLRS
jgi:hypothetical protein